MEGMARAHQGSDRAFVMMDIGAGPDPTQAEGSCFVCEAVHKVTIFPFNDT
jgi:hypothetical protein